MYLHLSGIRKPGISKEMEIWQQRGWGAEETCSCCLFDLSSLKIWVGEKGIWCTYLSERLFCPETQLSPRSPADLSENGESPCTCSSRGLENELRYLCFCAWKARPARLIATHLWIHEAGKQTGKGPLSSGVLCIFAPTRRVPQGSEQQP